MNFDIELRKMLNTLNYKPRILLHSCCAPCSSYVISYLTAYFDITVFYYNPNIDTNEEYLKRKEEQIRFIKEFKSKNKLSFLDCDYDKESFMKTIKGYEKEPEGGLRCPKCFLLRLEKTAQKAKELGYDYFGTTLTVSPYKNSKLLNEIGLSLETKYDLKYLISDFKKQNGYLKSIELSKKYHLYRQNYCGCEYSKKDRLDY